MSYTHPEWGEFDGFFPCIKMCHGCQLGSSAHAHVFTYNPPDVIVSAPFYSQELGRVLILGQNHPQEIQERLLRDLENQDLPEERTAEDIAFVQAFLKRQRHIPTSMTEHLVPGLHACATNQKGEGFGQPLSLHII